MRKIKEVLRLKWEKGFSARQIAKSCDVARSTVKDYLDRAEQRGLAWPLPDDLDEAAVEHMLFPPAVHIDADKRLMPPMDGIHQELRRKKGVTLQLLWISIQPVLQTLSPVGRQTGRMSPTDISGRGKIVCRLCRPDHPDNRFPYREEPGCLSLCGRPGRQ